MLMSATARLAYRSFPPSTHLLFLSFIPCVVIIIDYQNHLIYCLCFYLYYLNRFCVVFLLSLLLRPTPLQSQQCYLLLFFFCRRKTFIIPLLQRLFCHIVFFYNLVGCSGVRIYWYTPSTKYIYYIVSVFWYTPVYYSC